MNIFTSNIAATDYEPFEGGTVLDGTPNRRVHWLRNETTAESVLMAGLFTADPCVIGDYTLETDECIYVIEGEVRIEIADNVVDLGPGDIASFRKGSTSRWTFRTPFKEFFVLSA